MTREETIAELRGVIAIAQVIEKDALAEGEPARFALYRRIGALEGGIRRVARQIETELRYPEVPIGGEVLP